MAVLLAAVFPRCAICSRPATRHNATKSGGDAATAYACDRHAVDGRWNDLPAAAAIRWGESQENANVED